MALAAPLLIGLAILATYIGYLILQKTAEAWLRPLLQWLFAPRQSMWKRIITWPVHEIGKGLAAVFKYVLAILGGAFFLAGAQLARFFQAVAWTEDLFTLAFQRAFEATYNGLVYLREVGIPKLISAQVKPVADRANTAYALATAATTTLTGISTEFASGLRGLPWGTPSGIVARVAAFWNAFAHLWDQVFKHIVPRLDLIQYTTLPRVAGDVADIFDDLYKSGAGSLPRIRQRLGALEKTVAQIASDPLAWLAALLGSVAGLAMLARVLELAAPDLFCRNTRTGTKALCAMRFADFDELFAFFVQVAIISNFETYVRLMQGATAVTAEGIADLLEVA